MTRGREPHHGAPPRAQCPEQGPARGWFVRKDKDECMGRAEGVVTSEGPRVPWELEPGRNPDEMDRRRVRSSQGEEGENPQGTLAASVQERGSSMTSTRDRLLSTLPRGRPRARSRHRGRENNATHFPHPGPRPGFPALAASGTWPTDCVFSPAHPRPGWSGDRGPGAEGRGDVARSGAKRTRTAVGVLLRPRGTSPPPARARKAEFAR